MTKETIDLLYALMYMVKQFFYDESENVISHSYMAAEEYAVEVLLRYKLIRGVGKNLYVLDWNRLKELENEV